MAAVVLALGLETEAVGMEVAVRVVVETALEALDQVEGVGKVMPTVEVVTVAALAAATAAATAAAEKEVAAMAVVRAAAAQAVAEWVEVAMEEEVRAEVVMVAVTMGAA